MRDYCDTEGNLVQRSIYSPHCRTHFNQLQSTSVPAASDPIRSAEVARQRAFSLASLKILCNPDMTCFLTLTYDPKRNSEPDYLNDLKNLFRGTGTKYLATFERHKENNKLLHVHIICTPTIPIEKNEFGYLYCPKWHRGFSSVRMLDSFDDQFRASKYVFKYMTKSEKVKHKYVYSSRGLVPQPVIHKLSVERVDIFDATKYLEGLTFVLGELNFKYKVIKGCNYGKRNERYKTNARTHRRETLEQKWQRVLCT